MSPSKPSPPAGNADNDSRVYCSLEQLLALKQQASYIKFDARYRPAGLLAGRHRSRLRGRGMNFEELRGYRSGDSVRDIDWKASAHSRQKLVKVFTEETDRPTVLLVDQRRSLFFGSRERTKSVTAAEVAATLAWMVLDSGDRLGGVVFNNEEQTFLRPTRSSLGAMRILQMICDYNQQLHPGTNSASDKVTLDAVLARSGNYIGNNGTLILVSDGDGLVEKHLDHLEYLAHQHNVLVFLVADPLEYSIADIDRLVVSDGTQQIELSADEGARERFAAQFSEQLQSIKDRVAAHGLPFGVIDTVQPVDGQLQAIFGGRMMDFPRPEVFGNYMLKNFGDIVMPEDLPWWPIQPGWWVLLAVIVTLISTYAYRRYRHWQRNAYRRRALTELASMATLRDMNSIVKRATESAFPSDSTETLWGGAWIDYLNHKTDTPCFINGDDKLFNCLLTQPQGNWPEGIEALRGRVRAWLELHREETL